ncbi:Estrogen sulfotransferase [Amphibalanus amphitrite]|uniref:Estrogen sulfotransferase n=1 Tax=Amphibalanus amphitrite TaxID=1232801 RepID=A0A6A4WMR5_AMPAM|nr:Estrogen sulfotransferase [Amphibalanus amphitrite]
MFQMSSAKRIPLPFKIIPLEDEVQQKIAKDFAGYPNGLVSCNHWGFKFSATVTEQEVEDMYNHPLDPRDVWVVTPPKCGTTWTQEMVWLIANDLDYEGAKTPFIPDRHLFTEYFMKDELGEAPFIEHMIEAWNLRHHPNLCFLFYEDMKKDLRAQIRKVAKFFGKDFSEEQVDKLAEHLHIDNFKKNPFVNFESLNKLGLTYPDRGSFVRKGKTGDWKNHFTPEMNEK